MLATAAIVAEVAALAAEGRLPQLVVDPVLVSSTGHRLVEPAGIEAYLELLVPHAARRHPEPARGRHPLGDRASRRSRTLAARREVAEQLRARGARYVVVKGGHLSDSAEDVVAGPDGIDVLPGPRVVTGNDHGTGCSLSAAMAAHLAAWRSRGRRDRRGEGVRRPCAGRRRRLAARDRGTAPSTISGGRRSRRLARRMTLHDTDSRARRRGPSSAAAPAPGQRGRDLHAAGHDRPRPGRPHPGRCS